MPADGGRFGPGYAFRHPRIAEDIGFDLGEDVGEDLVAVGIDEVSGLPIVRKLRPRGGHGRHRPCGCPPRRPMRAAAEESEEVGGDDDDDSLGEDVDPDLVGYDEEIDALEGDDDDDDVGVDEDGNEDIGASYRHLENREQKLLRLKSKIELDLKTTPSRRRRKRKHLQKRLDRVMKKLDKIQAKKRKKLGKAASVTGRSVTETKKALENGDWNVLARREATLRPEAMRGFVRTSSANTATGARTTIRMLDSTTSDTFSAVQFAAGAGHRQSTVDLVTDQISYERLRVVGIEVTGTVSAALIAGAPSGEMAPQLLISTLMLDGQADQVTTTTAIPLKWEIGQNGFMMFTGSWDGLRQPIFLDKRDTVSASVIIGQLRTTTGVIDWTLQCSLVVDILSDDQLR